MEYTLDMVTTIADCDALLQVAAVERRALDYSTIQQNHTYVNASETTTNLDAELTATEADIAGIEQSLPAFTDGQQKDQMLVRLEKAKLKKFLLTVRRKSYGVLALIQKQYAIRSIDKEIAENDAFVEAINTRRKAL